MAFCLDQNSLVSVACINVITTIFHRLSHLSRIPHLRPKGRNYSFKLDRLTLKQVFMLPSDRLTSPAGLDFFRRSLGNSTSVL
jgi:hypothetical protein